MVEHICKKYQNTVDALAKSYDVTVLVFRSLPNLPRTYKYFLADGLMESALIAFSSLSLAYKTYNIHEKIIYLEIWKQYTEHLSCLRDITWEVNAVTQPRYFSVAKKLNYLEKNIRNRQNSCIERWKKEDHEGISIQQIQKLCETKGKAFLLAKVWDIKWTYPKIQRLKSLYDDITNDYLTMMYSRNNGIPEEPPE